MMARVAEIDRLLREWVEFRERGGSGAAFADIEAAVAALPAGLRTTLGEVYKGRGSSADHCRRLGCPETTLVRRIGRAHLLLADSLALGREAQLREKESEERMRRQKPDG